MNILGISCYYHDAAAALLCEGILVAAAEEERFTRIKHDRSFPAQAVAFCLRRGNLCREDLDYVVFYEKPLVKFERLLAMSLAGFPRSWDVFREAMAVWLTDKLWIKAHLVRTLGVPASRVLFADHHMSHAASSFFCSPFKQAAILTVDGVGEWTTATLGTASADWNDGGVNQIQLTHDLRFPHSLGLLYSVFTEFLGFEVNEGEYKVMGMAAYGAPRYLDKVHKVAELAEDGSLHLRMEYLAFHCSTLRSFSSRFVQLFGEPRDPHSRFVSPLDTSGDAGVTELGQSQYYADVAASIQRFTEEAMLRMARHLERETGLKNLCIAGGVALNSVSNGRILCETGFEQLFIPPAPGDSGGAVGAALFAWHVLLGKPRSFVLEHAYVGEDYSEASIAATLKEAGVCYEHYEDQDTLCDRITSDLLAGGVVGWFRGRFEFGPRALGNRSILADPRRAEMKHIVNSKIKFREPFRPFAPVVPEDRVDELFESPRDLRKCYPARYMLLVLPWKNGAGERIPAVNHVGTGRLQSLRRDWNPAYYSLVEKFGEATGMPVLLNTSFNLRGEPIVNCPSDAMKTFLGSGLDVLVLENFVVRKQAR